MPTENGARPFMEWLKNGEYRHPSSFDADDQVQELRKIVDIEDQTARKIAASMFDKARYMQRRLDERKKEIVALYELVKQYEEEQRANP